MLNADERTHFSRNSMSIQAYNTPLIKYKGDELSTTSALVLYSLTVVWSACLFESFDGCSLWPPHLYHFVLSWREGRCNTQQYLWPWMRNTHHCKLSPSRALFHSLVLSTERVYWPPCGCSENLCDAEASQRSAHLGFNWGGFFSSACVWMQGNKPIASSSLELLHSLSRGLWVCLFVSTTSRLCTYLSQYVFHFFF